MNELELLIRARDEASAVLNRLNTTLGRTNTQLRNTGNASQGLNQAAEGIRRLVIAAAGLAATTVSIGSFVRNASELEDAIIGVVRTTDLSGPALERFTNNIAEVSRRVPRARTELLGFAEIAGQLGVRGSDNLSLFAETIARLADSTNIIGEQGSLQLAQLINVTNEDFANIDRIGAAVAALGNSSATTEAQLVRTSREIANALSAFGTSAQDVLGLGAAVASLGQAPQLAASSISRTIREIQTAISTAAPELEIFADLAGTTSEAFTENFNADNLGAFLDVLEGLGDRDASETVLVMQELGLNGDELNRILPLLANNIDGVRESIALSNRAYDENVALINESNRRYATFSAQVAFLRNELTVLSATAGNEFLDDLANAARNLVEDLRGEAIQGAFRGIGQAISTVLQLINRDSATALSRLEMMALVAEDLSRAIADVAELLAEAAEGASDINVELDPVRATLLGISALVFGVRNAFRIIPQFVVLLTARMQRFWRENDASLQEFLSNLPGFLGGDRAAAAAVDNRDEARILQNIEDQARAEIERLQGLAAGEVDDLARRFSGLDAANAELARSEERAARTIESSQLTRLLNERVEAVQNETLSLEEFNQELIDTFSQLQATAGNLDGNEQAATAITELLQRDGVALSTDEIQTLFEEAREQIRAGRAAVLVDTTEEAAAAALNASRAQAEALARAEVEISEALSQLDRQFEDGNLSIRAFYEERERLTREGIDAQIEAQRASTEEGAAGEILQLQLQRRELAVETAREIEQAEQRLADTLRGVQVELQELTGVDASPAQQLEAIREQYSELLEDLEAEGDTAGIALVNNLINVTAARQRFDQLLEQAREVQRRIGEDTREVEGTAGLTAGDRDAARNNINQQGLTELTAITPELENLAAIIGDPELAENVSQLRTNMMELGTESSEAFTIVGDFLANGLNQSILSVVQGTQSLSEAFRSFANNAIAEIQRVIVQLLVQQAIVGALNVIAPGTGTAFAAATGGGGGGGGLGSILGLAEGGMVRGPGSSTSDSILRRLSNGEFVIKAEAVQHYGASMFEGLNRMMLPKGAIPAPAVHVVAQTGPGFNQGGLVGTPAAANNVRIVNVTGDDMFENYLRSRNGERTIMNIIGNNQ